MTATPHPYPTYRPCGVPWLGDVPTHWETMPNRALFTEVNEREHQQEKMLSVTIDRGVIAQGELLVDCSKKDGSRLDRSAYKLVEPGDIAYNKMRAWQGAVGRSELRGIVSPAYVVQRPRDRVDSRYFHYLMRTAAFTIEAGRWSYGIASDMWSLRPEHFKMIYSCLPPVPEQVAIVRYLNHMDDRIRRYASAKRTLIALLEEEKQAVINRAVTGGLDPNVRLKPSGVQWLGDVPEHWDRCRLRNVVLVVTTGSRGWSSYASDIGPLFIRVANLNRGSLKLRFEDTVRLNLPETSEVTRTRIQAGDLLISVTAYIGSVGLAPEEFEEAYVSQHVARCQPRPGSSSRWLGYVLLSTVGQTHGQISLYGGTKDGLSLDDVKNYQILLPPLDEQLAIVEHVDKSSADIDAAIAHARRQIELVQEFRNRLIADVVTGKLDVREAAAQLPEEGDDHDPIEDSGLLTDSIEEDLYDAAESAEELVIESGETL